MNKLALLAGFSLTAIASSVVAQEEPPYKSWVGGFASYYNVDSEKPEPTGGLEDGKGFGAELGLRFDQSWAVRFELGRVIIDKDNNNPLVLADDGTQIGVDMMYFMENDAAYLFGGLRDQSLRDNYRMAAAGIGKHWNIGEKWRVITEAATYYDFGQGYNEFSAKLGLAYVFGERSVPVVQPDTDGDGVYDAVDRCPATPPGTQVDPTGCNIDLDGDGVFNNIDECPRTPSGVEVNAVGCEVKEQDSDGDGVIDSRDQCPDSAKDDKVDERGCVIMEEVELAINLDILFANDSSVISNPDSQKIVEFVELMRRDENAKAVIEGHTSAVGDADYNQKLSERRADAVRSLLINEYGIDANRLSAVGYGETRLKYTENTARAHRLNRRIEASITTSVRTTVSR